MKFLMEMMNNYQDINVREKGISFAEEGFTQLYEAVEEANASYNAKYMDEVLFATGKGVLIGAAGVGLTWLSVTQFKKFKKRNSKGENKKAKELKDLDLDEALNPEVVDKIKNGKVTRVSKKNRDALANIIDEINEHDGGVH